MATCSLCKTEETELHENGAPVCPQCADAQTKRKPPATYQQILRTLLQDVIELTARTEQATEEYEALMGQIPRGLMHQAGIQSIKNASIKLSTARKELTKAYRRLEEHPGEGMVPEDLRRSG